MQRHRYAIRIELIRLLIEDDLDAELVTRVVDRLAELGVAVDALVRITVDDQFEG